MSIAVHSILHIAKMTGVAGTEKHLLTLLPGLRRCGLQVRLLILAEPERPMNDYAAQMIARGVPAEQMIIRRDFDLGLFRRLRQAIQTLRPDAVHTHLIHADVHGIVAARRAGVKANFTTCHNDDPFRKTWKVRRVQRFLWPRITRAIAISEWIRRHAIEVEGAPPEKVVRVYHGIEAEQLARPPEVRARMRAAWGILEDEIVFGSVCRLTEQKGIGDALSAFAEVAKRTKGTRYVIAGDGELRAALMEQARREGIADRVLFLGWREDVADVMSAMDVFLMPSHWEGFGLAAVEAMAAGLAVIATRVSALPEIVVDVGEAMTGRMVEVGDVEGLAAAMRGMAGDMERMREMGRAGFERARTEFSAERMMEGTMRVYEGEG